MHSSLATLLAYQDGELSASRAKTTGRHLENCTRCRSELRQAEGELRRFVILEAGDLGNSAGRREPDLEMIRARIQRWKEAQTPWTAAPQELHRQIVEQMDRYLGRGAAMTFAREHPPTSSGEQFLTTAERLFSAFLGHKSASTLVNQILAGLALEAGV